MNPQLKAGLILPLLLVGGLAVPQIAAAQIVVGGTSNTSPYPFGADAPSVTTPLYSGEFQQIYSASAFTLPIAITGISFASAADSSGIGLSVPETVNYNFTISLSNTNASVAAPSTVFTNNIGSNMTTVFSGPVTANLQANNVFDLSIPFTTPFAYTPGLPTSPNLLLDVFVTSAKAASQSDLFQAGATGLASEVYYSNGNPGSPTRADQNGLRTLFTVVPAPEPSPVLTLLLGAGAIGLAFGLKATKRKTQTS